MFSDELVAMFLIADLVGWVTMCISYRISINGYLIGRERDELMVWICLTNLLAELCGIREIFRGIAMVDVCRKAQDAGNLFCQNQNQSQTAKDDSTQPGNLSRQNSNQSHDFKWRLDCWVRTTSVVNTTALTALAGSLFLAKTALGDDVEERKASNFFRVVATVTSILLYLRLLTKLKSINIKLATFTTSIVEVSKLDIRYYHELFSILHT